MGDDDPRIIQAALNVLREDMVSNTKTKWGKDSGIPPIWGIARQHRHQKSEHPYPIDPPIRQWKLTLEEATKTEINDDEFQPEFRKNGMFFDRFLGSFSILPCGTRFEVGWQTGPRFGRGAIHTFRINSRGHLELIDFQGTWIS